MVLAIVVAIACPARLPFDSVLEGSLKTFNVQLDASAKVSSHPTIHRMTSYFDWQNIDGRSAIDQAEESDEGDEFGSFTPTLGICIPYDLLSLIPASPNLLDPLPVHKLLPMRGLCRLRC